MERLLGILPYDTPTNGCELLTTPEVGEAGSPSAALLFKNGSVSLISGRSSYLAANDFMPYEDTHFNTQFSLAITQALATFHATLKARGVKRLCRNVQDCQNPPFGLAESHLDAPDCKEEDLSMQSCINAHFQERDDWTSQVSRANLVSSNLSIMCSHFEHEDVSTRIIRKLKSIQSDITTFTQFLKFASAMQTDSRVQSIGPIGMCDIWVPSSASEEDAGETLVIRLRGGSNLQAPPLRDVTWIWLTLLRPEVLQERYMELCESYCTAFNKTTEKLNVSKNVEELTLFDVMRDLGDSFLHAFLTIVHKFTVSGLWSLDRQLHTSEGIHSIAEAIGFLVDNGIIGSLFIA